MNDKTKLTWRDLSRLGFAKADWLIFAVLFLLAAGIRAYPEIKAGYWPIGYDTLNAYLPELVKFDGNFGRWFFGSDLFYFLVWPFIKLFHLDPVLTIKVAGCVLYGGLSGVFYLFSRKYLAWGRLMSFLASILLMIQLPALRLSWDLFRNMLALIFLFPAFYCLYTNHQTKNLIFLLIFSILIVLSNPLVAGLWFALVAVWLGHKLWHKDFSNCLLILLNILPAVVLFILIIKTSSTNTFGGHVFYKAESERFLSYFTAYTQKMSYRTLVSTIWATFWLYFQFIIAPALYGFWLLRRNLLLSILTLWLLLGTFSSVIFGGYGFFVWDRWLVMLVFPFTIYAVWGAWDIGQKIGQIKIMKHHFFRIILTVLAVIFWAGYLTVSTFYTWPFLNTPAKKAKPPYLNELINSYFPPTMLNNAVGFENIKDVLKSIDYLNQQAPVDSAIVIDNRYRGIFLLKFDYSKRYLYSYAWSNKPDQKTLDDLRMQNFGPIYTVWGGARIKGFAKVFATGHIVVYREKKIYQNDQENLQAD